jgi:hypothetical protein
MKQSIEQPIEQQINTIYQKFGNIIKITIQPYIASKYFDDMKRSVKSMIFFRTFYYFYAIARYTQSFNLTDTKLIRELFFGYFDMSFADMSDSTLKSELENIRSTFDETFDYLYDVFFVQHNIYFSSYFNNMIKYFLPLPYELLIYAPVIVYRQGVDRICKSNNIDYLDRIRRRDFIRPKSFVQKKNVDAIVNDLDFHIPIKYFDKKIFGNEPMFYLVAYQNGKNVDMAVCGDMDSDGSEYVCRAKYTRKFESLDELMFERGYSFELLFDEWKPTDRKITIHHKNIIYISVMRRIESKDLFNVFPKINVTQDILLHNTGLDAPEELIRKRSANPSFFYLGAMSSSPYLTGRRCVIYKVTAKNRTINDVIDLTRSIVTYNKIFSKKERDRCVTVDGTLITADAKKCALEIYLKSNPDCDIGNKIYYVGRRKLHEILYKTRKYDASKIWVYDYRQDDIPKELQGKTKVYENIYHYPQKKELKFVVSDYDAHILKNITGTVGFFSTDYHEEWNTGGEIMLCRPFDHIEMVKVLNETCTPLNTIIETVPEIASKQRHNAMIAMKKKPICQGDRILELVYDDEIDRAVRNNLKHITIGNNYKIMGSYGRRRYITDIDVSNFLNDRMNDQQIIDQIQRILKNLPDNLKFVYMSLGRKYDPKDLIHIDWNNFVENKIDRNQIDQVEKTYFDHSDQDKLERLIENDMVGAYLFLKDRMKIKWNYKNVMDGSIDYNGPLTIQQLIKDDLPVLHFMLKYKNSFIIYDIALVQNKNKKKTEYEDTSYLMYYNNEWFYILGEVKRTLVRTKSADIDKNTIYEIDQLLEEYEVIRQINMQIYYLKYIIAEHLISSDEMVVMINHIVNQITRTIGYQNQIIDDLMDWIKHHRNDRTQDRLIEILHELNGSVFDFVNNLLKEPTMRYIEMMPEKPKYLHLASI